VRVPVATLVVMVAIVGLLVMVMRVIAWHCW
jgi:hypothetical protein